MDNRKGPKNYMSYNLAQNFDKLPVPAVGLIAALFTGKVLGFEDAYMVELRLDDPLEHMKTGGEGFIIHTDLHGGKINALHMFDENWCIVHKNDLIWQSKQINVPWTINQAREYVQKVEERDSKDLVLIPPSNEENNVEM